MLFSFDLIEQMYYNILYMELEKTICFTGKSNNSRETLSNIVKDLGGDVSSSINKSVDFLILGEGAGSKLDKAKKLNITIKNEDWLLSLVGKQE